MKYNCPEGSCLGCLRLTHRAHQNWNSICARVSSSLTRSAVFSPEIRFVTRELLGSDLLSLERGIDEYGYIVSINRIPSLLPLHFFPSPSHRICLLFFNPSPSAVNNPSIRFVLRPVVNIRTDIRKHHPLQDRAT